MKLFRIVFCGFAAICLLASGLWAADDQPKCKDADEGFVPMCNGENLDGWEGQPGWWQVKDGVLFAESTPEKLCTASHYLYWRGGEPSDFEMRFSYRIAGDGANSGVHLRSETRPNWDMWGYQADIDQTGEWTGCLFEHSRGGVAMRGEKVFIAKDGTKTVEKLVDCDDPKAELYKKIKPTDWNDYRIVAKGATIQLWINGVLMSEVEDHDAKEAKPKGVIAVQMHQGNPMKIEFRDLRIRIDRP